ncbi:hypothetical protein NDU88_006969 [Pleurodeles waltl]|uniref:Uncharacterized protein n=1 Tax=Pleurodeles waltl TaxID=8319 RepID=A0AAV7U045_PLEWA|nr:hypothetical protein NDU88_006969 [Pleurodeles waltl]
MLSQPKQAPSDPKPSAPNQTSAPKHPEKPSAPKHIFTKADIRVNDLFDVQNTQKRGLSLDMGPKLINIAFVDMNPFPLHQIRNRRAYYLKKVRLEFTELEAIRRDFLRQGDSSPEQRDLFSDDDEDS